ncbi:MAG: hypothetical protein K2Q01_10820 [Rickettsiales bacterium]|nr:hypothetical protein [Rickettsiales bacterium]
MKPTKPRIRHSHRKSSALLAVLSLCSVEVGAPEAAHAQTMKTPFGIPTPPPGKNVKLTANEVFNYDTNPLKLSAGAETIKGSETSANLLLNNTTDRSYATLDNYISRTFFDNADFNSTNFRETLGLGTKTERWKLGMTGMADWATTRTTEITSFGINAPAVRTKQYSAMPQIDYRINARNTIGLKAQYVTSTFESPAFTDYHTYSITPGYSYKFDEMNSALFRYNYETYQTDTANAVETKTHGPSVGWQYRYDENFNGQFTVGAEQWEQTRATGAAIGKQTNYVYTAGLNYQEQNNFLNLSFSRAQLPTGNGRSSLMTDLRVRDYLLVNDRVSLRGELGYRKADYIGVSAGNRANLNAEYRGTGGVAYRVWQDVDLTANYTYVRQTLINGFGSLSQQIGLVGVSYHPAEISF